MRLAPEAYTQDTFVPPRQALAILTNIRLGRKGLLGTDTLTPVTKKSIYITFADKKGLPINEYDKLPVGVAIAAFTKLALSDPGVKL